MYKLRPFLPLNAMKNVYYSLIYSHIIYAIAVWGSAFNTDLEKILILQKKALRLLTYNDTFPNTPGPQCSCNPIFCKLETMKVMEIYLDIKYQSLYLNL